MPAEQDSFVKRSGTTDRGKEYEDFVLANLSLKYVKNDEIEHFFLSSNHPQFGAFDDVVLEAKKKDGTELKYALQLKHVTNPDKGSFRQKLASGDGNFSIQKYCQDFKKTGKGSYNFGLLTNHKFDTEDGTKLTLSNQLAIKILRVEQDLFKFSDNRGKCFRFVVDEDQTHPNLDDYRVFFERFLLYTNQASVDDVKVYTLGLFQEMFGCDSGLGEQYLQFVTEWSKSEGKKKKLERKFLEEVLALTLLGPGTLSLIAGGDNEKFQLFRSLLWDFHITCLGREVLDKVQNIWGDMSGVLTDCNQINKVGKEYKLILESVRDVRDLDPTTRSKLFWVLKNYPLIVESSENTSKAVSLCQNHKYIIVGVRPHDLPNNIQVFQKLTDLDPTSQKYKSLLTTFTCRLKNNVDITLDELLKRNPKIEGVITATELLHMATSNFKMAQVVTLLALADPVVSKMCEEGFTPLHAACIKGDTPLVELIVSSDIDINGASKDGDSPVILATVNGHYDIVKILLECGANPNSATKDGDTSIQLACARGNYAMAKLLGSANANVNAADKDGVAPLQVAASNGKVQIVELLLELGVNVDGSNKYGESALYLACLNGHHQIVKLLLDARAKQVSNVVGNSPLHAACSKGHSQAARVLLEHQGESVEVEGLDENEQMLRELYLVKKNCSNVRGDTPLHVACAKGYLEVVQVLVELGVNVNVWNADGKSPRDLAQNGNHQEIVRFLCSHM